MQNAKVTQFNTFTMYQYPNGAKVCYKNQEDTNIDVLFNGGHRISGDNTAIAHLLEHCVYLNKQFEISPLIGLEVGDASTNLSFCQFSFKMFEIDHDFSLSKEQAYIAQLNEVFKLLGSCFTKLDITPLELQSEKLVLDKESLNIYQDCHDHTFDAFFSKQFNIKYASQPLGIKNTFGTYEITKNISLADLMIFMQQNFTTQNLNLVISSPLPYKQIEKTILEHFISVLPNYPISQHPFYTCQDITTSKYSISKIKENKGVVAGVLPIVNCQNMNMSHALLVQNMIEMFSLNESSCLYPSVVFEFLRKQGLIYQTIDESKFNIGNNCGFYFSYETTPEQLSQALIRSAEYISYTLNSIADPCFIENFMCELDGVINSTYDEDDIDDIFIQANNLEHVIPTNEYTRNLLETCLDLTDQEVEDIVHQFKNNLNLQILLTGNVTLSSLPSIDMLTDIAKGTFKNKEDYPANMQCDPLWKTKIDNLQISSLDTINTQAIAKVQEVQNNIKI